VARKTRKRRVVLASGVFDLLHLGHVKFLEEAKKAGGENAKLVVIVARDSTVKDTKGRKPIMPENQRRALVESLRVVDAAVLGIENFDIGEVIESVKPDVIALGYDQVDMEQRVREYVNRHGLNVNVVRVGKFENDDMNSSSKIREKIIAKFAR
jgi:FAD synthetase